MKNPTIEQAMAWPWEPRIKPVATGGFVCESFPRLPDFAIYGATKEELVADFRHALEVHLRAYIGTNKCIPIPYDRVGSQGSGTSGVRGNTETLDLEDLLASI